VRDAAYPGIGEDFVNPVAAERAPRRHAMFPGRAMRRRSVLVAGLAALLIASKRSTGQQATAKIPRVGIVTAEESERAPEFDAFRTGLRDLGYIEGRNIILEFQLAGGNLSLGPQLAAELAALPVDVLVAEGLVDAAVAASGHIPIVAPAVMDPVETNYVWIYYTLAPAIDPFLFFSSRQWVAKNLSLL